MSIVDSLLDNAYEDTQLLISNDKNGDDFLKHRDVDFIMKTEEKEKAETVVDFISDNNYGQASFEKIENEYRILIIINMPTTQQVLTSISALMVCISSLFSVDYDGWGCVLQPNKNEETQ